MRVVKSSKMKDMTTCKSLVVDLGTAMTKAGWAGHGEPDITLPSIVGRGRHKKAMETLGLKDSYVGRQAQSLQGILSLQAPFRQGAVQHWDDLEVLWDYIWEKEAILSNIDNTSPADHQVKKIIRTMRYHYYLVTPCHAKITPLNVL